MKRKMTFLLSLIILAAGLGGCKSNLPPDGGSSSQPTTPTPTPTASAPSQGGTDEVKTGLAVVSSLEKSQSAGEAEGLAQTDSSVVALTVDGDGRILACKIDGVQAKLGFTAGGKLTTAADATFATKQEQGAAYGMKKASEIGKEWNEQADALAAYVVGKTVAEVRGIAVNEEGKPAETELSASVTISISGLVDAIEKAVISAQALGSTADDRLGMGIVTKVDAPADAGEEDGLAQTNSTFAVVTVDGEGRVTGCILDGQQAGVRFSTQGKITSNLKASLQTKNELGEAYGMKKASAIGREWNEQAAAYADYATGKTLEELKGVAVSEEGRPTDGELAASVTIRIGDFNAAMEKAMSQAK